jgi:hypothetical protein
MVSTQLPQATETALAVLRDGGFATGIFTERGTDFDQVLVSYQVLSG